MFDNIPNDPRAVNLELNARTSMIGNTPPFPEGRPPHFRTTVHGMVFAGRDRHLQGLETGASLYLIPDPPDQEAPDVWVHREGGDLLGHLPPEISVWLAPWLIEGGGAHARAIKIHGSAVPTWRRLLLEVHCAV